MNGIIILLYWHSLVTPNHISNEWYYNQSINKQYPLNQCIIIQLTLLVFSRELWTSGPMFHSWEKEIICRPLENSYILVCTYVYIYLFLCIITVKIPDHLMWYFCWTPTFSLIRSLSHGLLWVTECEEAYQILWLFHVIQWVYCKKSTYLISTFFYVSQAVVHTLYLSLCSE